MSEQNNEVMCEEEKAIKKIQKILEECENFCLERNEDTEIYSDEPIPYKEYRIILDLYKQEKEKNKKLQKELDISNECETALNIALQNSVSKDKIKEALKQEKITINFSHRKLKKLSEEIGYLVGLKGTTEQLELFEILLKDYNARIESIKNLQELIEEEKENG